MNVWVLVLCELPIPLFQFFWLFRLHVIDKKIWWLTTSGSIPLHNFIKFEMTKILYICNLNKPILYSLLDVENAENNVFVASQKNLGFCWSLLCLFSFPAIIQWHQVALFCNQFPVQPDSIGKWIICWLSHCFNNIVKQLYYATKSLPFDMDWRSKWSLLIEIR